MTQTFTVHNAEVIAFLTDHRDKIKRGEALPWHCFFGDPPYALIDGKKGGLGFMNAEWDSFESRKHFIRWVTKWAKLAIECSYPGALGVFFGATRTDHWLKIGLENAGWDIIDTVMMVYGSGMPKSHSIGKAIDKQGGMIHASVLEVKSRLKSLFSQSGLSLQEFNNQCGFEASGYLRTSSTWAGVFPTGDKWSVIKQVLELNSHVAKELDALFEEAEREIVGMSPWTNSAAHFVPGADHTNRVHLPITAPGSEISAQWEGYGTQLKPSYEPIVIARAPRNNKTFAVLALEYGTGAFNIDGTRITTSDNLNGGAYSASGTHREDGWGFQRGQAGEYQQPVGRWPANLLLVHHPDCQRLGTKQIKNGSGSVSGEELSKVGTPVFGNYNRVPFQAYGNADGVETVEHWDCSPDCPVRMLDEQSGESVSAFSRRNHDSGTLLSKNLSANRNPENSYQDAGGASRFFYTTKASPRERLLPGLVYLYPESFNARKRGGAKAERRRAAVGRWQRQVWPLIEARGIQPVINAASKHISRRFFNEADIPADLKRYFQPARSYHPTHKSLPVTTWISQLIRPPLPDARLCVLFSGVGSEMAGALLAGWQHIDGVEREPDYAQMSLYRLRFWSNVPDYQTGIRKLQSGVRYQRTKPRLIQQAAVPEKGDGSHQLSLFDQIEGTA